tara:strand:+ start:4785 stop:5228 length:444 start_codon:yes stop_codon:yes gene_type:complete
MNKPQQLNVAHIINISKILWFGMLASSPMFLIAIFYMDKLRLLEPALPELKNILSGICVLSIPLALILLGRFKRHQHKIRDNIQLGIDNTPTDLQSYITYIVIGMSLCNLPAMLGLVLYILVTDLYLSLFFIVVSFFLGFLYKPELK